MAQKYALGCANVSIADSILDRLVHNAHRIELSGESIRKKRGRKPAEEDGK